MPVQDVFDGTRMDLEAELQQFPLDLVVTHTRVLPRDTENERLHIALQSWSSTAMRMLKRPFSASELAMPFQQRVRLDE